MMRGIFTLITVLLLMAPAFAAPRVGWMIYPYKLSMPEDQYQRLLNSRETEYVGIQLACSPDFKDEQTQERVRQLVKAGKKIVLQIWFGMGPPFSWERYNFPNIALDSVVREEFFASATDVMIDYFGRENLYAVHLMEETGMQFGWDVDMPGRPDRDDDGYDNGTVWDNPPNWIMDRCISGPNVLSIRKYNDLFRKQTALDMRYYPIWSSQEMERYRVWVQQTMEAGAHNEFAKHAHRKYPGLRVYAFNMGPALLPQSKVLDGQFIDPYSHTLAVYKSLRQFRTLMRPEQELVGMVWGNREKAAELQLPQQAACYMAGCDILSTFGDSEYKDDEWLNAVRNSVRPFIGLPVFRSNPKVLIMDGGTLGPSLTSACYWITGFTNFDTCEPWAEDSVDLRRYDLVLAWNGWHKVLPEWVRQGGVLIAVRPPKHFLADEGYLSLLNKADRLTVDYRPSAWMRGSLKLAESYPLDLGWVQQVDIKRPDAVRSDQFLHVVSYGKGLVVILPAVCYVHAPWQYEEGWETFRQFLTDVCRGALIHTGKQTIADSHFADPKLGNDYLRATSADGRFTCYILLIDVHGPNKSATSFVVPGKDLVSGNTNARLCHENPVVLVEQKSL